MRRCSREPETLPELFTFLFRCKPPRRVLAERMPAEEEPGAAMDGRDDDVQQFCLRWNNYQNHLANCFDQLLQTESFVDVTLSCGGQSLKAHKVVLSACSPYFQSLFMDNPCRHPIIIMRDIRYCELKALVDFMYRGEIYVAQENIPALLKVAEVLKIRGLAELNVDEAVPRPETPLNRATKRPVTREANESPKSRRHADTPTERSPGPSRRSPPEPGPTPPDALGTPGDAPPPLHAAAASVLPPMHADDVDIRPGIAEMIREEERAKLLENHAWLGPSTSSIAELHGSVKLKAPTWSQRQLQEAIQAVVTQRMRFTRASTHYGIPKGTLYDNILGKSKRMAVLDQAALTAAEEKSVLDFCCETSVSPYNRRTKKSLEEILTFVDRMRRNQPDSFSFAGLAGFRWWWAFCKKNSVVSLYFENNGKGRKPKIKMEQDDSG